MLSLAVFLFSHDYNHQYRTEQETSSCEGYWSEGHVGGPINDTDLQGWKKYYHILHIAAK